MKYAKSYVIGKHDSSSMIQSILVGRDQIGQLPGDKTSLKNKSRKAKRPNEADDYK